VTKIKHIFRSIGQKFEKDYSKPDKGNRLKKHGRKILFVFMVIFLIYSVTLVAPFVWLFINSTKDPIEFMISPMAWPANFFGGLRNYIDVWNMDEFPAIMFWNSLTLVVGQTAVGLFVSACTAYAVSKYKFRGNTFIYFLAVIIMFIPTTGSLAVYYRFINQSGMYDRYWGMIVQAAGGFGFNFLIMYGFFKNISWSYAEAAFIDGAGNWRVFLTIMMPQAIPMFFALGIMGAIGVWNDFMGPLLFYPSHPVVAVQMFRLQSTFDNQLDTPALFAATLMILAPAVILFAVFQKAIIKNMSVGGLKG